MITNMHFPLLKLKPFFGGQFGVPGSEAPQGLRWSPDAVVLYVDSGHADASDNADGTNPEQPLATVQAAVSSSLLTDYSIIVVNGTVEESVVTPDYVTGPSYVSIIGAGPTGYSPSWQSDAADEPALDMRAVGWMVQGFRFLGQTAAACIELRHTDSGADDIAIRTVIQNCLFDGLTTGQYGIWSHGCYDVWIIDCVFQLWNNVANDACGLFAGTTPLAIPYRNHIIGCVFWDNDNHAIFPCNGCEFVGNRFQQVGYAYTAVQSLNTTVGGNPGDDNLVTQNVMTGDYSVAGGYSGGAADIWIGNMCDDVAEAEVGDNGFSILAPT